MNHYLHLGYRAARRVVVAVVGGTVVLIGLAMTVLPGPAFIVIPVGLGILGLEFAWARRWLHRLRETANNAVNRFNSRSNAEASGSAGADPARQRAAGGGDGRAC
jgi:tellurite resistance protein TerC